MFSKPCSLPTLSCLPSPATSHLAKSDPHLPRHGRHPGEGHQEGVLHEQWNRPAEARVGEEEGAGEKDDEEPLVAQEQSSHHRHLHPTKDLLAQLQDEDMQDECDEEEKLGDQETVSYTHLTLPTKA